MLIKGGRGIFVVPPRYQLPFSLNTPAPRLESFTHLDPGLWFDFAHQPHPGLRRGAQVFTVGLLQSPNLWITVIIHFIGPPCLI